MKESKISKEISRCLSWATRLMLKLYNEKENIERKYLLGEDEFSFDSVVCQMA